MALFLNFEKGQGRPPLPPPPSSYALHIAIKKYEFITSCYDHFTNLCFVFFAVCIY